MPRFRFCLSSLFGFVTMATIGLAALLRPNELSEIIISTVALALLVFAVLATLYAQRASRAFWIGFAIVSWGYCGAQQFGLTAQLPTARIENKIGQAMHMARFAEVYPDVRILHALRAKLSWTHFRSIIYLDDPLKRDFYAEMCRVERWSTRTLEKKVAGMLLQLDKSGIRVAAYLTELPPRRLLKKKLHAAIAAARARLEHRTGEQRKHGEAI